MYKNIEKRRAYDRKYYKEHIDKNRKTRLSKLWRKKQRSLLDEYKKSLMCVGCNNKDFRCLEFHHTNKDKENSIANLISGRSFKRVLEEIKKCEILCANCHRILHYQERVLR